MSRSLEGMDLRSRRPAVVVVAAAAVGVEKTVLADAKKSFGSGLVLLHCKA